jgi:hypothetical protein
VKEGWMDGCHEFVKSCSTQQAQDENKTGQARPGQQAERTIEQVGW